MLRLQDSEVIESPGELRQLLTEFFKIPGIEAIMIADAQGNLLEHVVESSFEEEHPLSELRYITKVVSFRYDAVDFHKILDDHQLTIDVFGNHLVLVTSMGELILLLITNKESELQKTVELLSSTRSAHQGIKVQPGILF